jgi:hypothetical protein
MGRLEDIVERNRNPRRHRKGGRFPFGLAISAFVLLILILVIFTDLGVTPYQPPPKRDPSEKRVDGVLLYRPHARPRADAGTPD